MGEEGGGEWDEMHMDEQEVGLDTFRREEGEETWRREEEEAAAEEEAEGE